MTVLDIEGRREEYPDLLSLVQAHPEIEEAVLIYRFTGMSSKIDSDLGFSVEYGYSMIDWSYSFVGSRSEGSSGGSLESFAEGYVEWDDAAVRLKNGLLEGYQEFEDTSPYPNEDVPDCDVSKRVGGTADGVVLFSVTLPSGKRVYLD